MHELTFLNPTNQFLPSELRLQIFNSCGLLAVISYELLTFAVQEIEIVG